jgi:hypothetical protein
MKKIYVLVFTILTVLLQATYAADSPPTATEWVALPQGYVLQDRDDARAACPGVCQKANKVWVEPEYKGEGGAQTYARNQYYCLCK